ncbi:hypothetical protein [Streptomyces puniciscabiei]|uniref:hypothetical protein n=1 Tax=Streptomyces puniciscabiei TaxID=164348 RepID=UPI0006EBB239|nr:hypothetical protein [Streptomyces puniciscabiei]
MRRIFTWAAPGEQTGGFSLLPGGALAFPLHAVDEAPVPDRRLDASVAFFLPSDGSVRGGRPGGTAPPGLVGRTHDDYAYQLRTIAEPLAPGPEDVCPATLAAESPFTSAAPASSARRRWAGRWCCSTNRRRRPPSARSSGSGGPSPR